MTRPLAEQPRIERLPSARITTAVWPDPRSSRLIASLVHLELSAGLSSRGESSYVAVASDPDYLILLALDRLDPEWLIASFAAQIVLDELQIDNIAVFEKFRGRGIASRLLTTALNHARQAGCRTAYLEVRSANIPALQLYLKAGFQEIGRRPAYYQNPTDDAITMSASL